MELYQASIKDKGKRVESHSIENIEDIKINNVSVLHTTPINEVPLAFVEEKSLEISNFLEDETTQDLEWWENVQI